MVTIVFHVRLTHIVDRLDGIGGVQTYLTTILPALADRGVECSVVTASPDDVPLDHVRIDHIPGIQGDGAGLRGPARALLRAVLAERRPDACVVHVAPSPGIARTCSEAAPTIIFAHDYFMACPGNARYLERDARFCYEGPGVRCFTRAYTQRCTNRRPDRLASAFKRQRAWAHDWQYASRVLVASPFVGEVLQAHGVDAERLFVLPYFAEPSLAPATRRDIDVLFLGRLVRMKGADVLLRAVAEIPHATCVIAGDGPERASLERLSDALALGDRVCFTGAVGETRRTALLSRARVLALPSLWAEPFGIVGLEALAAGVPVVASATGGIPSWLLDGANGVLVKPGDAPELVAGLVQALGDPVLLAKLAAATRATAERFSLEQHIDLLLAEVRRASGNV